MSITTKTYKYITSLLQAVGIAGVFTSLVTQPLHTYTFDLFYFLTTLLLYLFGDPLLQLVKNFGTSHYPKPIKSPNVTFINILFFEEHSSIHQKKLVIPTLLTILFSAQQSARRGNGEIPYFANVFWFGSYG